MTSPEVLRLAVVSDLPLDVTEHHRIVAHARAGAQVVFCGVVRNHDHGRDVVELEYVGHPTAGDVLVGIAGGFAARPDVLAVAVSHRVGVLAVGDVAIVAAVASAHRRVASEVCARLVEEVKARLPVWKRQTFADGTDEWVNCP